MKLCKGSQLQAASCKLQAARRSCTVHGASCASCASDNRPPLVVLGQKLQALAEEEGFACSWGSCQDETPLFTSELQRELLNVHTLSLADDLDVWQEVWSGTELLVEEGVLLVLSGHLPPNPSKHAPLTACGFQEPRLPMGTLAGFVEVFEGC